jgi:RHS repeat-associated protein
MTTNQYSSCALTYDDENRLTMVSSDTFHSFRGGFVYDGLGRMRERIDYGWNGSSWIATNTVLYIYDGWRVIQERDGGGTPTVSYTRGDDLSGSLQRAGGIGGLLARSDGYSSGNWTTHNYYFADGNGNITYMLDSSQSMVASYRYDPFGNTISKSGALADANVYRFSSKEIHANGKLYYYGYRFYDPNLQRWLTRDPIAERGDLNLYRSVRNHPTGRVDSWGLQISGPAVPPAPPGGIYPILPNSTMGNAADIENYEPGHIGEFMEPPERDPLPPSRHRDWPPRCREQNVTSLWPGDPPPRNPLPMHPAPTSDKPWELDIPDLQADFSQIPGPAVLNFPQDPQSLGLPGPQPPEPWPIGPFPAPMSQPGANGPVTFHYP